VDDVTGRDDAVRAAAEALRRPGGWNLWPADAERIARDAVDAAAPHLTADLVRERDEALAALTELRPLADAMLCGEADVLRRERDEALALVAEGEREFTRVANERDEALAEVERLRADHRFIMTEARGTFLTATCSCGAVVSEAGLTSFPMMLGAHIRAALRGDQS
jgi:hypothetical protein